MTTMNTTNTLGSCWNAPSSAPGNTSYSILILCRCIAITIIIIRITHFKDESTEIGEGKELGQGQVFEGEVFEHGLLKGQYKLLNTM